ncbi:hypothetical protein FSOLCH5_001652 [Fusarium solani]
MLSLVAQISMRFFKVQTTKYMDRRFRQPGYLSPNNTATRMRQGLAISPTSRVDQYQPERTLNPHPEPQLGPLPGTHWPRFAPFSRCRFVNAVFVFASCSSLHPQLIIRPDPTRLDNPMRQVSRSVDDSSFFWSLFILSS